MGLRTFLGLKKNRGVPSNSLGGGSQEPLDAFQAWEAFNKPSAGRAVAVQEALGSLPERPGISILMPVYNPPLFALREAVESVLCQSYEHWQLVIVDDASTDRKVRDFLSGLERRDPRLTVRFRDKNGHISQATNDAGDLATLDFVTFLDHDDRLPPDALAILAIYLVRTGADLFYSDDVVIADGGGRRSPKFKSQWSPELLLSYSYVSHLKGMRRDLYGAIGGCRLGFEGSQDHDLFLRATERARNIVHIPHILYERRALPTSTASSGNAKPYSFDAGARAVKEAFARRGSEIDVLRPDWAVRGGYGIYTPVFPDDGPSVAILIPTFNSPDLISRVLKSLERTSYRNYAVYVIDNGSDSPEALACLRSLPSERVISVPKGDRGFNFAHINNVAASQVKEEFLLFLNDDTQVIQPNWLSQMVGWGRLEGVGVVGARLLYPDGRLQHGGVTLGAPLSQGLTLFRGSPRAKGGYLELGRVARNVAAVTAACMLTRRDLFLSLNGFDEERFGIAYNDVDYCVRARKAGLRIVFAGEVELLHDEGASRSKMDAITEIANMRTISRFEKDPYLNPSLESRGSKLEIRPKVINVSDRPAKILAFTHNLNHEGAPNSQAEVIIGLARKGSIEPVVVSPIDGPLRDKYANAGIPVHTLDSHPLSESKKLSPEEFSNRLNKVAFKSGFDVKKFDVVYANTALTFWAIHMAAINGVPSVWNIRESENWQGYYRNLTSELEPRALKTFLLPYRTVFVAESTRRQWASLDRNGTSVVINNALPAWSSARRENWGSNREQARNLLGIAEDKVVILNVGTVCSRKSQIDLLEAVEYLPEAERSRCEIIFVGARPGSYLSELTRRLEARPWKSIVRLIPETGDIGQYWAASDVFCFTSKLESYPRVILEAMAAGLPIVTTNVFGIAEQVREGANALLFAPGDRRALAEHLRRVISDDVLRKKMARLSEQVLESLNTYPELLDAYESVFKAARESAVPDYLQAVGAPRLSSGVSPMQTISRLFRGYARAS